MYIKNLSIKDFRNYDEAKVEFSPRVNMIIGKNAQGKTNLIEALSLSSIGRSFRTSKENELIMFGKERAFVSVSAEKEYTGTKVDITIGRNQKKIIKKDGKNIRKTSELIRNIIIVTFSPEDLRLVKGEPSQRRRFLDKEAAQIRPVYYENLSGYRRALMQRNICLRDGINDYDVLDIWDQTMINYGAELMMQRRRFISKLGEIFSEIYSNITGGKEKAEIKYMPNIRFSDENNYNIEKLIESTLYDSRENDMRRMITTRGPHKDDMIFLIDGTDVRNYGSQGQQRTCALSLKLAELELIKEETGENGILLLDDVMSELDEDRRNYLIGSLSGSQVFVTGTEADDNIINDFPDTRIFKVSSGDVLRV